MKEIDNLFNEFLKSEAKTGKKVKLVKMTKAYFDKVSVSLTGGCAIGIPFEINNDQSEEYIFVI